MVLCRSESGGISVGRWLVDAQHRVTDPKYVNKLTQFFSAVKVTRACSRDNSSRRRKPTAILVYFSKRPGLKVENQPVLNYVKNASFVWPTHVCQISSVTGSRPGAALDIYSTIENLVLPPGCRPTGRKLSQVRGNWLCRRQMPWGDGILECWNNGFIRMRSFLDTFPKSEIKIKIISVFYTQYSLAQTDYTKCSFY